jgi:hypothetical protein
MYDEIDEHGKRRDTVDQIAAELGCRKNGVTRDVW